MPSTRPWKLFARIALATSVGAAGAVAGGAARGSAAAAGDGYHALTPARVLDTRTGTGAPGPVGSGAEIRLDVTGVGGVPESGVAAVVLNVTAAEASASTYVTVWPTGQPQPNTSNLNVQPGVDTPNLVIATVGADGMVSLANQFGSVQLIADVSGWFATGSDYRALTPARILDTRADVGAPGPLQAVDQVQLDVTGVGGVPESGVAAVVLNVTAVEATAATYVTVWPTGQPQPNTSNLNVQPGVDTPNLVIATVGADGMVSLGNYAGSVNLIADVTGWFPTGSDYRALSPSRVLDTRTGVGATGPVPAGGSITLDVTGVAGVPATGVAAVALNVTAAEATDATYVTVWPSGQPQPNTSNLNVRPGVDTPNLVIATVGADGTIRLANQFGSTHLIADVAGWIPGTPAGPGDPGDPGTPALTGTIHYATIASVERVSLTTGLVRVTYGDNGDGAVGFNDTEFATTVNDFPDTGVQVRDLDDGAPTASFTFGASISGNRVLPSPDGELFAAIVNDPDDILGPDRLLVVRRDGTPIALYDNTRTAAWMPNGDLAFVGIVAGNGELGVLTDVAGGAYTTYYDVPDDTYENLPTDLAISPDGNRAAYTWNARLYALQMDGASGPELVAESAAELDNAAFSPDSASIVVRRDDGAWCAGSMHVVPARPPAPVYVQGDGPTAVRTDGGARVSACAGLHWTS